MRYLYYVFLLYNFCHIIWILSIWFLIHISRKLLCEVKMGNSFTKHGDMALNLVDLAKYPIENLEDGKGAKFLKSCQQQMDENGWCNFSDFIKPNALEALRKEAMALQPIAETLTIKRNIYNGKVDPSAPKDDPRRREYTHVASQLADDQISESTLIKQLYKSEKLKDFIRRVQRKSVLYRVADEFQALNIVSLHPGSWHAWHYDTTECTVTLLLQAADKGGEFTFLPNSRTDDTEDRDTVDQFLAGDMSKAKTFSRGAGAFTLFRGGYSLHGVTQVEGERLRITSIMTYSEEPETILSDEVNVRIYGKRVEKILASRKLVTTNA